jgi:ethanolamine utilization protein EutA
MNMVMINGRDARVPPFILQARRSAILQARRSAAVGVFPPDFHLHDDDEPHFHEISGEQKTSLAQFLWKIENVELTTVGIDIGSSTSHLMFARVHLQRKAQQLSSQFVVVERKILWKSPILLTPFLADNTIDAARLRAFIDAAYRAAGLTRPDIDTGAVILTGEAIKRRNAQALAELFAEESGKFVCASAGHHMEARLAAHGSGAVALSRRTHRTVLNVDMGGGTTKFALIQNGEVKGTCAVAVGGRLLAHDDHGRWTRIDDSAHRAARARSITLQPGGHLPAEHLERIIDDLSEVVIGLIQGQLVSFSGGVSEYLFGREPATYGDIARPLADRITRAFADGRIKPKMVDPGQGIRATVIGASQFTVQVSGKTIHISGHSALPVHNVPVLFPLLPLTADEFSIESVERAVREILARSERSVDQPLALAIRWRGDPHYRRMRNLAEGIARAIGPAPGGTAPLVLLVDGDVGRLLGKILENELRLSRGIVSIDGIHLQEFDHVDIGSMVEPANVVPVVIKSMLFSAA